MTHKNVGMDWVPEAAWSILWPDKSVLTAATPTALLDALASVQWNPCSRTHIKARLSDRASAWSGTDVDDTLPDDQFLLACEGAGLFVVMPPTQADLPPQ